MEIVKDNKTALVFGASGLVGSQLLKELIKSPIYEHIIVFNRSEKKYSSEKITQHVIDFSDLRKHINLVVGDDLFYCIGSTIKKAGSKKKFIEIDLIYPTEIARMASANQVSQFLLVSAVNADAASYFFYNKVKGEVENALRQLDFWALHIFQPSLLLGQRKEFRLGEEIAKFVGKGIDNITDGALNKYRPVEAKSVAKSMLLAAQGVEKGIYIYPSHYLHELAKKETSLIKYQKKKNG